MCSVAHIQQVFEPEGDSVSLCAKRKFWRKFYWAGGRLRFAADATKHPRLRRRRGRGFPLTPLDSSRLMPTPQKQGHGHTQESLDAMAYFLFKNTFLRTTRFTSLPPISSYVANLILTDFATLINPLFTLKFPATKYEPPPPPPAHALRVPRIDIRHCCDFDAHLPLRDQT